MTFEEIKHNPIINTYITKADETLAALGFTEHSFAHVTRVADTAQYILKTLGFDIDKSVYDKAVAAARTED